MQPLETLYIESTRRQTSEKFSSLMNFMVQEVPGQVDTYEPASAGTSSSSSNSANYAQTDSIIYIIDSQDEYLYALQNLLQIVEAAYKINPRINFEILIHKVDGLSDDFRLDTQRDIMQRVTDELSDVGVEGANLSFYLTSIFDHSIYETFSRILQKLVPNLSTLENLLDILCQHSAIEKAFLFDMNSKLYLSTDSSPVDVEIYQVCSDFIDLSMDLDDLYTPHGGRGGSTTGDSVSPSPSPMINGQGDNAISDAGTGTLTDNTAPFRKSVSTLQNGIVLYMAQMIRGTALVGLLRSEGTQKMILADYNIEVFRQGLLRVYGNSTN